jgi:hypothetical protein
VTTFPHVLITAEGGLGDAGGNEIWTCGHKVVLSTAGAPNVPVAPDATDLAELSASAAAAWTTFIESGPGGGPTSKLISDWCSLKFVKAAPIAASGRYDPLLEAFITDISGVRGGALTAGNANNGHQTPYNVALVTTFMGDTYHRGAAAFGRVYVPVPNLHVDPAGISEQVLTNGLMSTGQAALFGIEMAALLRTVNATVLTSGKQVHCANISKSEDISGLRWQTITHVRVDERPDTVRRRYNALQGAGQVDQLVNP